MVFRRRARKYRHAWRHCLRWATPVLVSCWRRAPALPGFQPGDRVACAGVGYASHGEINFVPANLAVLVPANVGLQAASLTTIGAIAMQGVRQANVTFGETVAVIGVGLVGVLAIQILRAAGCRVIAIDLSSERAAQAMSFGAHLALATGDPGLEGGVASFSRYGVDAALITAATTIRRPAGVSGKAVARSRPHFCHRRCWHGGLAREHVQERDIARHVSLLWSGPL